MQYRKMGKTGLEVSALGFGLLRPPLLADGTPDESSFTRMLHYAIDHGVNYMDTAYTYLKGQSEVIAGKALAGGYRKKVYLTTKCPSWLCKSEADFDRILDEQLRRLQTDYVDFYFLHGVERHHWEKYIKPFNLVRHIEDAVNSGKARYAGFSFHDNLDLFKEIIASSDVWSVAQIQLNYYDRDYQAGLAGMRYAAEKGLGVGIMEPLRGGFLAAPPENILRIFSESGRERTPVEWALDYLWSQPEISVVLSGMGSMEMVRQNIEYAERFRPEEFTAADRETIEQVVTEFKKFKVIPCTGCSYCSVCPQKIAIPKCFEVFNNCVLTGKTPEENRPYYNSLVNTWGKPASQCVKCGMCKKVCPQHIEIPERLAEIAVMFEGEGQ